MKKFMKYALICAMTLPVFTSCHMLDEETFGAATVEDMLKNEENVVSLVGQAYADLRFMHDHWGYWGVNTLTADEGLCPVRVGGDWNDGGYWKNLNTHNWNSYGKAFLNIWNCTVAGSVLCNNILETLYNNEPNMTPELYKMYVGEMEVLRSYYYYLLFDSFGRIPYMEDYSDRNEALLDPAVTWAHLVSCLERNAPNMAESTVADRVTYNGRCTKGMAYALLAKLYLNAESYGLTPEMVMSAKRTVDSHNGKKGDSPLEEVGIKINSAADFYTNAIRCCNEIISTAWYDIEPSYFDNFLIKNGDSNENIFTIVEDGSVNNERDAYACKNKLRIEFLTLHYLFQTRYNLVLDCWNGFIARPEYMDIFNDHDVRGDGYEGLGTNNKKRWGWFVGPVCAEGSTVPLVDKDSALIITRSVSDLSQALRTDGARMFKYELDQTGTYKYMENDFPLIRYPDVIYMKVEAKLRGGNDDKPGIEDDAIKAIKKRAFAYSDDPVAAFDAAYPDAFTSLDGGLTGGLLAERGRELSWENCRRRDLIRFDQFENVQYVTNKAKTRRWFPIPFDILQKSVVDENGQKLWTQNEGY